MSRFILLALCLFVARVAIADEPSAALLARECDALIAQAVKRPYGWAWADSAPEARPKGSGQTVNLEPGGTAAAGFVLYWAGDLLDQPRYKDAAYQAARGVIASQRSTGVVLSHPTFLPNLAGGKDERTLVSDRAPTCAAMALMLTLTEEGESKDPVVKGSAMRGMNWLIHQQAANGAWVQADPPSTQPSDAVRLIRLDNDDWRNSTFTLLLASDILNEARYTRAIERSNTLLLRMRIGDQSRTGRPLWATAYGVDAFPSSRLSDIPPGIDTLASRQAMETLLATVLVLGDPPRPPGEEPPPTPSSALTEAAAAIAKLPKYDDKWLRLYDYDVEAMRPPAKLKEFDRLAEPPPLREKLASWGLDDLSRDVEVLNAKGRNGAAKYFAQRITLHQRLAAAACGLEAKPFRYDLPRAPVARSAEDKTADQIEHIWKLLLLAKADHQP